jgi:hypothetical protein
MTELTPPFDDFSLVKLNRFGWCFDKLQEEEKTLKADARKKKKPISSHHTFSLSGDSNPLPNLDTKSSSLTNTWRKSLDTSRRKFDGTWTLRKSIKFSNTMASKRYQKLRIVSCSAMKNASKLLEALPKRKELLE